MGRRKAALSESNAQLNVQECEINNILSTYRAIAGVIMACHTAQAALYCLISTALNQKQLKQFLLSFNVVHLKNA